jgi:Transposase
VSVWHGGSRTWSASRKIDLEVLRQDALKYPNAYQHERAQRFGVAQNANFVVLKKLTIS